MQEFADQRVTEEEAKAVLDLWSARQEASGQASVRDLAEALRISEAEVSLMLHEIRAKKAAETLAFREEGYFPVPSRRRRLITMLAGLLIAGILVMFFATLEGESSPAAPAPAPVETLRPAPERAESAAQAPSSLEGAYRVPNAR